MEVNTSKRKAKQVVESPTSTLDATEKDFKESSPSHHYLFNSECASVDTMGKVFVMPVPLSFSYNLPVSDYMPLAETKQKHSSPNRSDINFVPVDANESSSQDDISGKLKQGFLSDCANGILETQSLAKRHNTNVDEGDEASCAGEIMILSDEDDCEDLELSPRLTNFIKSGVVPDSPVYDQG